MRIYIQGIGSIDDLNPKVAKNPYVVYIDVKVNPWLQAVFDTLERYEKFRKEWYAIRTYAPHITLAYDDLTQENFEPALEFLKNENPFFQFTLDNFSIVAFDEEIKRWKEYKRFYLK